MIDGVLLLWYILTALSLMFLVWDQITNTPSMWVMALAWFLVILYTGPIGLFFYLISCRQPFPDSHDQFINVHWKQALGSEIHCVAGDATAIIITAAILSLFSLPNGIESIIEYVAAYLFGLFIFQALFMLSMFGSYWQAVRRTIFVETVSMNMVMTGMIPVILVLKSKYPASADPASPYFWAVMSLATFAGFILGYPINSWMVKKGIKHGMMTKPSGHEGHHHHHPEVKKLSRTLAAWTVVWTYAVLVAVVWLMGFIEPVKFS